MDDRLKVVDYKGIKILMMITAGLSADEGVLLIKKFANYAVENNLKHLIIDATDSNFTEEIKKAAMDSNKYMIEKLGKIYSTTVGAKGIQRIIANVISKDVYFATDVEDAKEWLYKHGASAG